MFSRLNLVQNFKYLNNNYESLFWKACAVRHGSDDCRRAIVDIPPKPVDKVCKKPCRQSKKPPGILHRIKLKVMEGGSNFGTPFWRLRCKSDPDENRRPKTKKPEKQKALPPPEKPEYDIPDPLPGMQVAILGAESAIGQYVALLLKQCTCIKRIRLFEAADTKGCTRKLCQVAEDLKHIDTNCCVQAFSACNCCGLERCLQNSNIVLILESAYVNIDMPFDKRFYFQAPMIKKYTDVIANECPKAFIIVNASPIDCMVPLIALTLKETGWYDSNKVLGSLAVPEMRATTLAARALGLEPRYTRVPCVGGTEGATLVPLFSRAVEYFDFATNNSMLMTQAVRNTPQSVVRQDACCTRAAELSEAHALAGLVTKVAHALLCNDVPNVTGFVETDPSQVISPARFIANHVSLSTTGVIRNLGLPKMSEVEVTRLNLALKELQFKLKFVENWYCKYCGSSSRFDASKRKFFTPKKFERFYDCAYATV